MRAKKNYISRNSLDKSPFHPSHINIPVLVQSGEAFRRCFDVLGGEITWQILALHPQANLSSQRTYAAVFDYPDQPPVAIAVVKQHHRVTFSSVGLALDCCYKSMQSIHEFETNVL